MPVYHFVLHAFGFWHPDREEGWHQHGDPWPRRCDEGLGIKRRNAQRWPTVTFADSVQESFQKMAIDICLRRRWRCHAIAVTSTHIHVAASWRDALEALEVQASFKRILGWYASKLYGIHGRRWFSDGGRPRKVDGGTHLRYLIDHYLPEQGGVFWVEPKTYLQLEERTD